MKRSILCLLVVSALAVGVLVGGYTLAQTGAARWPASSVAVCDLVEVFNQYERAHDLTVQFQQRGAALEQRHTQLQQELEAQKAMIDKLDPSGTQYPQELRKYQQMRAQAEAEMQYEQEMARRDFQRLTQEMHQQIRDEIAAYAQANGIDIVLFRDRQEVEASNIREMLAKIAGRQLLYYSDRVDITDVILSRLNAQYNAANGR